jgi:hypothetical protein
MIGALAPFFTYNSNSDRAGVAGGGQAYYSPFIQAIVKIVKPEHMAFPENSRQSFPILLRIR